MAEAIAPARPSARRQAVPVPVPVPEPETETLLSSDPLVEEWHDPVVTTASTTATTAVEHPRSDSDDGFVKDDEPSAADPVPIIPAQRNSIPVQHVPASPVPVETSTVTSSGRSSTKGTSSQVAPILQHEPPLAEPVVYSRDPSALMRNPRPIPPVPSSRQRHLPSVPKKLHLPGKSSTETSALAQEQGTRDAAVGMPHTSPSPAHTNATQISKQPATATAARKPSVVEKLLACMAPPPDHQEPLKSSSEVKPVTAQPQSNLDVASPTSLSVETADVGTFPSHSPNTGIVGASALAPAAVVNKDDVFQSNGPPDVSNIKPHFDYKTTPQEWDARFARADVDLTPPTDYFLTAGEGMSVSSAVRALGSVVSRDVPAAASKPQSGTLKIRMDRVKQTIRGLGFSNAFYTNWWHEHPNRQEIYRLLFQELQPTVIRLRNAYALEANSERDMSIDAQFIQSANSMLSYKPQILLTSWTPPANIKASGRLLGGGNDSVLGKDRLGRFLYYDFSRWWVDSVRAYARIGIVPNYVSIQNEPDYNPTGHPGCLFGVRESATVPGYYRAADEVHAAFQTEFKSPPVFIGPECFQMDAYVSEHPYAGGGRYPAMANHLYASGNQNDPYSYIPAMERIREIALIKQIPDVFMTEFAKLGRHEYEDPMRLGIVIHNALTIADATMYLHWDGCWAAGAANDEGTLLLVDNPFTANRSGWRNSKGYTVLHSFYWFQHFTRFVRPGYRRVQVDIGIRDVLSSAWTAPFGVFSLIMINTAVTEAYVTLLDIPDWIPGQNTDLYYSTLDIGFTYAGRFRGDRVTLLPRSITTIFSYSPK